LLPSIIQSISWAIENTYYITLQATPCKLVFGRDMIHNIASRENWDQIQKRKQDIINKSNKKKARVECVQEWYNRNPKRNCIRKSENP
jgi:hypothetical protein